MLLIPAGFKAAVGKEGVCALRCACEESNLKMSFAKTAVKCLHDDVVASNVQLAQHVCFISPLSIFQPLKRTLLHHLLAFLQLYNEGENK